MTFCGIVVGWVACLCEASLFFICYSCRLGKVFKANLRSETTVMIKEPAGEGERGVGGWRREGVRNL